MPTTSIKSWNELILDWIIASGKLSIVHTGLKKSLFEKFQVCNQIVLLHLGPNEKLEGMRTFRSSVIIVVLLFLSSSMRRSVKKEVVGVGRY